MSQWKDDVSQSQYDSGHSYSGAIGMLDGEPDITNEIFASHSEAENYLSENQQKWNPAMAVKFKEDGKEYWMFGGWCAE